MWLQDKDLGLVALEETIPRLTYTDIPPHPPPQRLRAYFEDMLQLPRVGVPHFEQTVVDGGDNHVVIEIPCDHGDFELGRDFLFRREFDAGRKNRNEVSGEAQSSGKHAAQAEVPTLGVWPTY